MWSWLDSFFARYEFLFRIDGAWLLVRVRRIEDADHLVFFNSNGQEVTMQILHEGNEITVTAAGAFGPTDIPKPIDPNFELEWTSDVSTVVAISPVSGTPTAKFTFLGEGVATITAKGDADLTTGVKEILGTFQIQAVAQQADHLVFTFTPETPVP